MTLRRPTTDGPAGEAPASPPPIAAKQTGDAAEHLVAGMMTLAGMPTFKAPENWPAYDLIAQPPHNGTPQRISVKSRREKDTHKLQLVMTPPDDRD